MFRISRLAIAYLCLVLAGVLSIACTSSPRQPSQNTTVIGAGSTFINPAMTRWISDFQQGHSGVQISYQSIGSGGGIQQVKQGLVDFGASDAALNDQQLHDMPPLVQIPETAGPVCITYNLPSLKTRLRLSAATLTGIYLGQIKRWKDPVIQKDNEGVSLPNLPIAVVHRSDGSGTTNIFTIFLATASQEWARKVGQGISVAWPVGAGGKAAPGSPQR